MHLASRTSPTVTQSLTLNSIFWLALALAIVSQVMILRSTVRAMRAAASNRARRGIEWAYAVVPAIALVVSLVATWHASRDRLTHLEMEAKAIQTVAP